MLRICGKMLRMKDSTHYLCCNPPSLQKNVGRSEWDDL